MSILGNSSNVAIDNAKLSNAGRDVKTTTQHANSAFASSSDQVIVMDKPNVINAGGNVTYITWNFQLLELATAALSLAFSPFRTRVSTAEPQSAQNAESSGTGRDTSSQNESELTTGSDELDIGVTMFPNYDEGNVLPHIRKVGSVLSKAYIENMIQLGIGYPMWTPQPNIDLPLDYRRSGISIGDLGVIADDGDFDFLFNVLLRANDAVNLPADLPDDFNTPQRPKVMPSRRTLYNEANNLSNLQNIKTELDQHSEDISFLCKDNAAGAILALPHGASENDLKNKRHWMKFISQNALSWYRYARDNCGRDMDRHSLYLISGHTKSKAWGLVTFNTPISERNDVLVMGKSTSANAPPYIWKEFGGASIHRSGPMVDRELINEVGHSDIENQCLFLRGFKISLSEHAWNELCDVTEIDITKKDSQSHEERHNYSRYRNSKEKGKDESGSHSSSQGNLVNSVSLYSFPSRSIPFHPSTKINNLLLSLVPDAQIAITHDSVWMNVAKSKDYEQEEMLAAIFGSRFVASYYEDTGMCTFEPVKELIPMLKQAGSLSEDNIKLYEFLTHLLNNWNNWTSSKSAAGVADCLELCTEVLMGKELSETLSSIKNLTGKYIEKGKWAETEYIQIEILEVQARTLGKEHPDTVASMHELFLTYDKQNKWTDAENLQSQILEIRTRILGIEHSDTLASMHELASTYYKQGKWTDAKNLLCQVLEMRTRILGNEHRDTLASMHELSLTYEKQNKWTDVENLQSQILEIRTRILGVDHSDTLASMHELALTYCGQDRWADAENLLYKVQEMRTRILGNEHPDTLASMHELALTYCGQDRWADAENLLYKVQEMRTKILGNEHPDTLASMHELALTYCGQDRWADAENLLYKVQEMRTRILGNEHPDTLASMHELALTYCGQDRWADAENLLYKVQEMRTKILGNEHPDTLASMHELAFTYYEQDKWTYAEYLQSQILEIRTRILGKEHPDTLAIMHEIALTCYEQGKWTDAENLESQVLAVHTKILGKGHPDTLAIMQELAATYFEQDRWVDTENLQSQVLEMRTRILGKEHPGTLASMHELAMTYYKQNRWTEAENLQRQVMEMRKRILGKKHPDTLASEHHLNLMRVSPLKTREVRSTKIVNPGWPLKW